MNEAEAIARCLKGDAIAYGWVMREYKHLVHTVSLRVLRHHEDAEESTQDAFVKAFQNLGAFQGGSKLSTWLYSIAYRTAVSKLRGRKKGDVAPDDLPEGALGFIESDRNEAADRKQALEKALAELPEEDATVITLFYLHEQSIEEIVTITGLTASNVKVKLHRSRKRMHATLQVLLKDELWTIQEL
ncbi:MAG: sigma-70 family RNA polymerase sigma factor [Flavobacteriales bacterium]|nr:sigma-70 family RNA polymerase sigma factor [Flavobacteriales bacterium]